MTTVIQVGPALLAKIVEDQPDFPLKVTQAALSGYAERYVKPIMKNPDFISAFEGIRNEVERYVMDKLFEVDTKKGVTHYKLPNEFERLVRAEALKVVEEVAIEVRGAAKIPHNDYMNSMKRLNDKIDNVVNEKLDAKIDLILANIVADSLERKVDMLVEERLRAMMAIAAVKTSNGKESGEFS